MQLRRIALQSGADIAGFRRAVRHLISRQVPPSHVAWSDGDTTELFDNVAMSDAPAIVLPRSASGLIELVLCHRDPERFALLYQLIWRLLHGEHALLEVQSDPLVHRLERMRKSIRRDIHKMHAFLRFRMVQDPDGTERYVAWFEPEHHILEVAAPFFAERFPGLIWSILTPLGSLHWDGDGLTVGPAGKREDAPDSDEMETAWCSYYENIFNPARLNPQAMRTSMPKKYWRNMPEASAIPSLIQTAPARVRTMIEQEAAMSAKRNPEKAVAAMAQQEPQTLAALNRLIAASEPLVPGATRAVLGEGPLDASIAFVGEQPGDQEDRAGRPFVGPAGQLLDRALEEVGIDRTKIYITNAVKHFKFEQRGKKRIHQKPTTGEVKHYRWWLLKELSFVQPRLVVALGATAALALAGKAVSVTQARGETQFGNFHGYITVHPSYLLRIPEEEAKRQAYLAFCADLKRIRDLVA